ncbi:hypothetical protein J6590_007374 [Homalodisca vitripennis]|nr:hypothetical protein J6590_007374 [Homalodisca vitripennis]
MGENCVTTLQEQEDYENCDNRLLCSFPRVAQQLRTSLGNAVCHIVLLIMRHRAFTGGTSHLLDCDLENPTVVTGDKNPNTRQIERENSAEPQCFIWHNEFLTLDQYLVIDSYKIRLFVFLIFNCGFTGAHKHVVEHLRIIWPDTIFIRRLIAPLTHGTSENVTDYNYYHRHCGANCVQMVRLVRSGL